jgi:hypothetical protein
MICSGRAVISALLLPVIAACGRTEPAEPAIGFAAAGARPLEASRSEVLASGGRGLGASSVRRIVAVMGEQAFRRAIDAGASAQLVLRPDGAVCVDGRPEASCVVLVADGRTYRVFDLGGQPRGTLTPADG